MVITAYNEEQNIAQLIRAILAQHLSTATMVELVVVCSGCTDATVPLVQAAMARDPRIRLIVQDLRLGKAAAVNAYFRERAPVDFIVISSADILPQPGCFDLLVGALSRDPRLGMVGGRPMPKNPRGTFVGNMVNFQWDLHHERALEAPKLGEVVALRSELAVELDEDTAVDEASLEATTVAAGYRLGYVPGAVVANWGPANLSEFFEQRRRINAGHHVLKKATGYAVSTMDWRRTLQLAARHFTLTRPRTDVAFLVAMGIETLARGMGWFDMRRDYSHAIWTIVRSAHREVEAEPAPGEERQTG